MADREGAPTISVVIPVYNGGSDFSRCLASLGASCTAPLECIVVDDGSRDGSAQTAVQHGAKVLSTGGRHGPAHARNIGAQAARGDILLFLDADVCVHPDTVSRIVAEFENDPSLDALMGSYDRWPSATGFVSQYRNLMHCFVHQSSQRKAVTFWAGCGAIRRSIFLTFGGFDEVYRSPSIEDIELGYRLAQADRKLIICPEIQATHMKNWSFRSMLKTDFLYRALPWSELSMRSGRMPNTLNLRISDRISVVLAFLVVLSAGYLSVHWHAYFMTPLFATFFILLSGYWLDGWSNRSGVLLAMMAAALALIVGLSYAFRMFAIIPMVLTASLALFTRHRYAYSREVWRRRTRMLAGGYCLLVMGTVWIYIPWKPQAFVFLFLLATLVVLNKQFYLFLAANRGKLFALAAIPFHLLYFFSSGAAFLIGFVHHYAGKLRPATSRAMATPVGNAKTKASAR